MIWTLIKLNIIALFAGIFRKHRVKKKTSKKAAVFIALFALYLAFTFMLFLGMMFNTLIDPFFEAEIGWFYFSMAGISVFALCFFGIVFMAQPQLFNARDNELLLSMPVKPSAILAGRLSALLLVEYIFAAVILVPAFMVFLTKGYIAEVPTLGVVFFFVTAFLIPLLALSLGCIIGWIIALIAARITRGKTIIMIVLSVGFLGAYMWFASRLNNYINVLADRGADMAEEMRRTLPPIYHLGASNAEGSISSFIIFTLCAIVPFVIMCALLSASFTKMTTGGRSAKKVEYREQTARVSGPRAALLIKELWRFWSLPTYILNASLGVIATIIATVVLIVHPSVITNTLEQFIEIVPIIDMGLVGIIALGSIAALNNVSAPSISLEGKQLWFLKSLPLAPGDILLMKAVMHVVICGIPTFLAGVVCIFVLPVIGFLPIMLILILPMSITVMFALIGIALNLRFPRFDWTNPIQPVKQGLSSMLTLFGGIALIFTLIFVYAFISYFITIEIFLLLCAAAASAVSAALYYYLINKGSRKFEEL